MQFDKGIPIPEPKKRGKCEERIACETMEVGDSFLCTRIGLGPMRTIMWNVACMTDRDFTAKREGDAVRVWRTA